MVFSTFVADEPCTFYKAQDIANARENIKRYKWAQDIVKQWENMAEYAAQQDRVFFERMIPELTGQTTHGQNCPVCVGKQSTMGESDFVFLGC